MKLYTLLIVFITAFVLVCCNKNSALPADTPSCILQKIEVLKKGTVRNPPASIWQFEYNNQTVYYIPPYCCDIFSELYDANCNLICHPDGGLTGNGDGKCPNFSKAAKNAKLIWQDDRKQ